MLRFSAEESGLSKKLTHFLPMKTKRVEDCKRLTVLLLADVHARYRIVVSCAHLFNFRTRLVVLNYLRTTYTSN